MRWRSCATESLLHGFDHGGPNFNNSFRLRHGFRRASPRIIFQLAQALSPQSPSLVGPGILLGKRVAATGLDAWSPPPPLLLLWLPYQGPKNMRPRQRPGLAEMALKFRIGEVG